MSVTLNGTTGFLEWAKGAGVMPVSALGFTIIARIRTPSWVNNQFAAAFGQSNNDRYAALWADSGARIYANQRNPGNGSSATLSNQTSTSMQLAMAVFGATNSRAVCNGSSTFGTDAVALVDDVASYDRFTIGAYHTNNASPSFFWQGDIAEVHIFNRALTAADYATLNADYKPEQLAGWVDGWSLKDVNDLVSLSGTRTLTLTGGVTSTGTHPITRAVADTTPPTLSAGVGTATGPTTATIGATTDEGNGTLFAVVTTSATAPTAAQVKAGQNNAGTAAAYASNQAIAAAGAKTFSATGLTASTTCYPYFVHTDAAGNNSTVLSGPSFTTQAVDTTPPTLSAPIGTATGPTTATIGATTDEANGTMYAIVSTSATQPTAAQIQAGQTAAGVAAPWSGSVAVASSGAKTFGATGLSASTAYYSHVQHKDASGNNSTVVTSTSFTTAASDTTPPNLSSAVATKTGASTATLGATTDEANGTMYVVATTSATAPTAAQVKAGQNNAGTAAAYASSQVISSVGAKTFAATGLSGGTVYYTYLVHTDAAGNNSAVLSAASFTTDAYGTITTPPLKNNTNSLLPALTAGWTLYIFDANRNRLATKTGLSTDSNSRISFTDATLTQGGTYYYEPYHPTYGGRLPSGTAA